MRVRIKRVPQARTGYQVRGALANDVPAMGVADYDSYASKPNMKFNKTLSEVPREEANLEAEGKETVMMNTGNIPAFYTISGPRHAQGGVPLNLPDDSFIYSDFREMKLKDPALLAKFGKAVKKGKAYTPAELSKQYDINKYRTILQDPDSDKIDRKTAELMIRNYNMKLGALALAQEAKKGFPQGIPAVAKPFMEANGLSEEDFIPQEEEEEATEAGLEAEGEEMMEEEGQAPQTMPDGSPVAMPQGQPMPEQGAPEQGMMQPPMQYGGYPMAAYGMEMGGYGMPFYSDPNQMAYGGNTTRMNQLPQAKKGDGGKKRAKTAAELKFNKEKATKVKEAPKGADWVKTGENQYSRGSVTTGNLGEMEASSSGGGKFKGDQNAYVDQICANMKNPKSTGFYMKDPASFFGRGKAFSDGLPAEEKAAILAKLQQCLPAEAIQDEEEHVEVEAVPVTEQECECTYPDGSKTRMPKNADNTCPPFKNEEEIEVEGDYGAQVPMGDGYAPWWLQDTVNTMGAYGDLMSTNKYMPWAPRVDLEEPRPTFLDPTRELAAQSEQANIAAQASNAYAGSAQQMGARLAAIQGTGAEQAANTLSNINNQNVGIANQFEGQQVEIRNNEQLQNQNLANELYDQNTIANQQFDNTQAAKRGVLRSQYNNAVTNRAKTDAMNQMYPNYAVDPSSGGFMNYVATQRNPNPIKPEDMVAYAQSLEEAGLSKEVIAVMVKERMRSGNAGSTAAGPDPNIMAQMYSQRGGFLKNGGFVYADMMYPFIF